MQKACFKCKVVKPLSEFYKHSRMADGHLNKCKDCAKNDVRTHRAQNLDKVRQYDRERGKRPERIKAGVEMNRIWRAEDKRRQKAHNAKITGAGTASGGLPGYTAGDNTE